MVLIIFRHLATNGQVRFFMPPPVSAGLTLSFAHHFRGRGFKKRDQAMPQFAAGRPEQSKFHGMVGMYGAAMKSVRRMPDIDDPRPPIVAWKSHRLDVDGSLPIYPIEVNESPGRKVLQGLYQSFKEIYQQHYTFVPLYGGGPWSPFFRTHERSFTHRTASVCGAVSLNARAYLYPSVVLRGDLNDIKVGWQTVIMEGTVVTTDGHPRNINLPGRVSRLDEGITTIGNYCIIHPNCFIDSAYIDNFCEIGEGSKLCYNSFMEYGSSLEPGTVLLAHQRVPRFEVWGGNPARKVGSRQKNIILWMGYVDKILRVQVKGLIEECSDKANYVSATRSSEKLQNAMDRLIIKFGSDLPPVVKQYIEHNTRDVPLWEEYKNMTRLSVRPGVKKFFDHTVDPNKAKWADHY